MTPEEVKRIAPNASKSCIEANSGPSGANAQSGVRHGPLAKAKAKDSDTGKRSVSITSFRVRLADVDALCGKWHLDALRYAGLIHDDTTENITYQIRQKKVETKEEEKTLIEISL